MAYDVARRVSVEIVNRKDGQLLKYLLAHFVYDALAEVDHNDREKIGQKRRDNVAGEHKADVFPYNREVNANIKLDRVYRRARVLGSEQRKLICAEREEQSDQKQRPLL